MSRENIPVDLEKALDAMKSVPVPDPEHQLAAKQAFLAQARRIRQAQAVSSAHAARHREQPFRQRKEGALMMVMARIALILLVLSGAATGTALAADASEPGQPLYPLDLQMEQVQTMLATTAEAQNALNLGLSAERANEVRAMVQSGQTPDQAVMERFQNQFGQTLQLATQLQDEEMVPALIRLRDMAQEQGRHMQSAGFAHGEAVMSRMCEQAQNGIDDPAGFRRRYRGGRGQWEDDQPVGTGTPPALTGTPEATRTPGAGSGDQDQIRERDREQQRDQQQEGSGTPQNPNVTPGGGSGNGGNGGGSGGGH